MYNNKAAKGGNITTALLTIVERADASKRKLNVTIEGIIPREDVGSISVSRLTGWSNGDANFESWRITWRDKIVNSSDCKIAVGPQREIAK